MADEHEIKQKFWKALTSDMTLMVGIDGVQRGHPRPMTALLDGDEGPIWFFTSKTNNLVELLPRDNRAIATFTSKGHDLFATIHGDLHVDQDRSIIDRLWNPYVAAWFKGGKDDPLLTLLRLDPKQAEIWLDASSLMAGLKTLIGIDPKKDYKDSTAKVDLRRP